MIIRFDPLFWLRIFLAITFAANPLAAATDPPPVAADAAKASKSRDPDAIPEGLAKSDWHSIRAAHHEWKHEFRQVDGAWQARNVGQAWTTTFNGRGFTVTPDRVNWTWGLEFQSYGFGDTLTEISGTPEVRTEGQRLSYRWNDSVEEWFVNDQRGLEHGFILQQRPDGRSQGGPLNFTLSTTGNLYPTVSKDAQTIHFRDDAGAPILNYSGLKVWDADGVILSSKFTGGIGREFRIEIDESDARYPITIDPVAQQAFLKASNTDSGDSFGISVAVSGDTVVIGATGEDSSTTGVDSTPNENASNSGAAYIFVRIGNSWTQQGYLKASNTGAFDSFGSSVSVSGDTVVIGAEGEDSSTAGVNGMPNEDASQSGAAYVFKRTGNSWVQQAFLKASNTGAGDNFGSALSLSGDTVAVGAEQEDSSTTGVNGVPDDTSSGSGAAYVFLRSGTTWSQQAYLKASNTGSGDLFAHSVALAGDTLIVGSPQEDGSATGVNGLSDEAASQAGAAYVFVRNGSVWSQQAYLKASNSGILDGFGWSVAVSGETAVIGAPGEASSTTGVNSTPDEITSNAGAAHIFIRTGTVWNHQAYLKSSNTGADDFFGWSVAVSGNSVVVGANQEDGGSVGVNGTPDDGALSAGSAYLFSGIEGMWSQTDYLKASNTGAGDNFGGAVAVFGDTILVGAVGEDSGTTGVNGTANEDASGSGAAYIFKILDFQTSPESDFTYTTLQGVTIITGYVGSGGIVVIPQTLDGNPVNKIGSRVFENNANLSSIVIPEGVMGIGIEAFSGCSNLENVFLPDSLTGIDQNAFAGCSGLTRITLPGGLTSIGGNAFSQCTNLMGIVVPDSVTRIDGYAFEYCYNLKTATLPAGLDKISFFLFRDCRSLEQIVIPAPVTIIEQGAFSGAGLTSVTFPPGLLTIEQSAFSSCSDLTEVTLPHSLVTLGNNSFVNCSGLVSVSLSSGLTTIESSTFSGCDSLTTVKFPDGMETIGSSAFAFCDQLASINFSSTVTNVEFTAFRRCPLLETAYFQGNAPTLGSSAFLDTASNFTVYFNNGASGFTTPTWEGYQAVAIQPRVITAQPASETIFEGGTPTLTATVSGTPIPAYQWFVGRTGNASSPIQGANSSSFTPPALTTTMDYWVRMTDSNGVFIDSDTATITVIPPPEFTYTTANGEITITDYLGNNTTVAVPATIDGLPVTVIGSNAFLNKSNITAVTLPASITSIEDQAFRGCLNLISINLPAGLTSIGNSAFFICNKLDNVILPDGLISIGNSAFHSCKALSSITIPDSVATIGINAFNSCSGLRQVVLPSGLTKLEANVFLSCSGLTSITIPESVLEIDAGALSFCSGLTSITIPVNVDTIGARAFQNCTNLSSVTLPEGLSSLGSDVFRSCSSLTSIAIPNSITSIPGRAFTGCIALTEITLPDNLNAIGNFAFDSCSSLVGIVLPNSVTSIGFGSFQNCSSLTSIIIPAGVTSIGVRAFENCSSLSAALFLGNAPSMGDFAFEGGAGNFTVYFLNGSTGFTEITWRTYPSAIYQDSSITAQPSDAVIAVGGTATLRVAVSGSPLPEIQWYEGVSGDTTSPITGETGTSYTTPALGSTTSYWVQLTSLSGTITNSNTVTVQARPTPVAHWKFDETTGGSAADSAGSFDGTLSGSASFVTGGISGNAISLLNAGNSLVNMGNTVPGFTSGDFTIVSWIKTTATNGDAIFAGKHLAGNSSGYILGVNTLGGGGAANKAAFYPTGQGNNIPFSTTTVNDDEWHQVVGVYTAGGNAQIYVDGVLEGTRTSPVMAGNTADFLIGGITIGTTPSNQYEGLVDDVQLYSSALSESDIAFLFTNPGQTLTSATDFSYVEASGEITITGYSGSGGAVTIPSTIDGFPVTGIGQDSFLANQTITSVALPEGITGIGNNAFKNCTSLVDINLPDSITLIGGYAFEGCTALAGITLPQNLSVIEVSTFAFCSGLTSLVIPETVNLIGAAAFAGCTGLTEVHFPTYVNEIQDLAFFGCNGLTSISLDAETIGTSAFGSCISLDTVVIRSFQSYQISSRAFEECANLSKVYFPFNAPMMGSDVFINSAANFAIYFNEFSIGFTTPTWEGYPSLSYQDASFTAQPSDQTITTGGTAFLSVSVSGTFQGIQWFEGASGDTSTPVSGANDLSFFTQPLTSTTSYWAQITFISGNSTNSNTATVTVETPPPARPDLAVDISAPTTATGGIPFDYTITVRNIGTLDASGVGVTFTVPAGLTVNSVTSNSGFTRQGTGNSSVVYTGGNLPEDTFVSLTVSVTSAGAGTYSTVSGSAVIDPSDSITESNETNNSSTQVIRTVVAPPLEYTYTTANNEVTITGYTGSGGAVSIPSTIGGFPVTEIGDNAFAGNTGLTSITIPASVTSIGANAFQDCSELITVNFPANLANIGDSAFFGCSKIQSIVIPSNVTSIGNSVFRGCFGLTSVILPSSLTSIGSNAFRSCSITSIIIPAGVGNIGFNAFQGCNELASAIFLGNAPSSVAGSAFLDTASGFTVYFSFGATGFTTPTWLGYPSVVLESPSLQAPSIVSQPSSKTISSGTTTSLSVSASGNPPPQYQWFIGNSGDTAQPISGATSPSFTTPVLTSTTSYWVRATNSEGTADSSTATVTVQAGSNANLKNLALDTASISPGFNQLTLGYASTVPNSISAIRVLPTAVDAGAAISVNGFTVASGGASGPISLSPGGNVITVVVTSSDVSATKTYTINVTRSELPTVTTEPATNITSSGLVMQGTVDPNGTTSVFFEYGPTAAYGSSTPVQFLSSADSVPFQAALSGLGGNATVHYRAVAPNGGTPIYGVDRTATTLAPRIIVATGSPVVTGTTAATLVGVVNNRNQDAEVYFDYGTTIAYGNSTTPRTIPAASGLQDVIEDITGLIPGATYHVRLVVSSPSSVLGNDVEFEVEVGTGGGTGSPTDKPSVTTGATVDVLDTSGTLKGTANAKGGTTTAYFEYGTTTSYGQVTQVQAIGNDTLDAEVSIPAENLLPGTRYYYRIVAENSQGVSDPDAGAFFDTEFAPPAVTTGVAEALTTTSVSISGTVRARNADTDVEILYGTNPSSLSNGATASPALVTGDSVTDVSADIEDLLQSVTYYYRVRAVNSGGTTLGPIRSFRMSSLSGILQIFPDEIAAGDHLASIQVNLSPSGIGAGWRLAGEQEWRLPGTAITGMASGDRVIEYRAVSGYIQPQGETAAAVSGDPTIVIDRTYTSSGATGSGSLTVNLKPESIADPSRPVATRAQWRLLGETNSDWKNSGVEVSGLVPGNHVVECKPLADRSDPPPASVVIADGITTVTTITYFEADPEIGSLPEVLEFDTVNTAENLPYGYVGQIRSDAGSATGFVVRPRVVATAAHIVFDDGTLSSATGLQWLFQRHRGVHEPNPLIPRGFYTMTGYAAQREIDNSPGISTPESQHLDAAAMYFTEEAGRGGFSGYLASDLEDNEFLLSSEIKTLVGYPIENIPTGDRDRMHATTPANITFTLPTGLTRTFATADIRSTGGNSGGPLCVLAPSGKFYPAGIYLGGTGQTLVRAIDSDVATLFGFAEISGDSADGGGSGSITDTQTTPVGTPALGSLQVIIEPAGARSAGAGWRIGSGSYRTSGDQIDNLSPNSYGIQFATVPGFEAPSTPSLDIIAGELKTVTFTYEIIIPPPVINSATEVTLNKGDTLTYQISATNSPDMFSLSGLLPLGTVFDPAIGRITGIAQEAGVFPVVVGVSNTGGTDTRTVQITSLPVIAPQSVVAPFQTPLTYQIVSSESGGGAVFAASNLPPGLVLDESTGEISGTPTTPGTYESPISVTTGGAIKGSTLTFNITGTAPSFVSQPAANVVIEYGENAVLSITTGGLPAPSVQWYRGASGDTSQPVDGATGTTFVSQALTSSTSYWARITNLSGSADSDTSNVQVLPSDDATLVFLSLGSAALSPSFDPTVTSYATSVPNSIASISLTPNTTVPVSTVSINGTPSPINSESDPIGLSEGANTIDVLVTAQDGVTTQLYAVTVTRAPAPVVITLGSDGINDISATIRGSVNPKGSGTVFFDYGPTTSYGSRTSFQQVSGTTELPVSASISGLSGNTTYHYRVGFQDGGTPVFGNDMTFLTAPARPLVVTGNAVALSETGATLIGIVNPRGSQTDVHFEYGTDENLLGTATPVQDIGLGTSVVEVTSGITGLSAGVTYYYRTVAQSTALAQPVYGETKQFVAETVAEVGDGLADSPPEVIPASETASSITSDSAVLEVTINPNDGSTLVYFEYGTSAAYGFQSESFRIGNGTQNALVTIPVGNLETGETYFFRTVAENAKGTVIGTGSSFTTTFDTPFVVTGEALPISTRSARVTGTVQANGITRDVYFKYGTDGVNFTQSVRAFQQTVSGNVETPVFVDLVNLTEGVTYFYKLVATDVGEADGTDGEVLTLNASALVGLLREAPSNVPSSKRQGEFTANLRQFGKGGWRFVGEQAWRSSGEASTALTEGDRQVEFRPVAGFIPPPAELITISSGASPLEQEYFYYESGAPGSGSLQVTLFPTALADAGIPVADRAQWRLASDEDQTWNDSGDQLENLAAGTYLIECKAVSGWDQPVQASVIVSDNAQSTVSITYLESATVSPNPPSVVPFATMASNPDLPYAHVGQVRSNLGSFSGFAVKPKVVATVGQAVFDEATLSTVTGLQWLLQRDPGTHEPIPQEPRGSYVFTGYDDQRIAENTPGVLSVNSQNLNVAALYFFEDAGRGGYSGFLASDETDNEFLLSSENKILAGYPVGGISPANQGRMHATAPSTSAFTWLQGKTFTSPSIRGLGGMAGGPLGVLYENGDYYPAGIYLGGTTQGLVRAIDSDVIDIFTRAEVSANGGDNNNNGGITQTSIVGNLNAAAPGALKVIIEPESARLAGAFWRLAPESSIRASAAQKSGLAPGTYSVEFTTANGFLTPSPQSVTVTGGQLTTVTFAYATGINPLDAWRFDNFGTYDDTGDAANDEDPDKDGRTNSEEFTAGTDPNSNTDHFEISTAEKSAGSFTTTCAGKAGRIYTLQRNTGLSGEWIPMTSVGPLASDEAVSLTDLTAPADSSFYRIEVSLP